MNTRDEHNEAENTLSAPGGWCCSEMEISNFNYTWTIKNFSFYGQKCGEKVESAIFPSGCREDVKWCLDVYPNGNSENYKGFISVFLRLVECRDNEVDAKYTFSILDFEGNVANTCSSNQPNRFLLGGSWGWSKFVSREALFESTSRFLHSDSLTILCNVSVSAGKAVTVSGQNTASEVDVTVPSVQLSEDLGRLLQSEQFGDVVFNLGGRELRAHKNILVARCPVFASMFEHEMTESIQNRVDITDIDHEVFREMLRFIYTGRAPDIDKFPMDLLVAADKYALERLKAMCERAVTSSLSEDNAAEVLVFSDMHSAHQLKAQALKYICAHASDVKKTAGWKNMLSGNPALALEVSTALISRATSPVGPHAKRRKYD
ncbi:hypothetical protein HPB48_014637 [Haemaphysalis longicornis]|uniref:Speckle-type POZ protein n=1 Tax=Haemaphysalis longicornis TaxID=44386 RepID=A0A9J6GLC4_HAELO|nr:hypothetical protein HPB48_014637 [Haemaphysalis longicornis]